MLEDAAFDATKLGGAGNWFMWSDWEKNAALAEEDLPGQSAAVQRGFAAYMTLGYYEIRAWACDVARAHFPVIGI